MIDRRRSRRSWIPGSGSSWRGRAARSAAGPLRSDATAGDVTLRTLECAGDSVRIAYAAEEAPADVTLTVDGAAHPLLEVEHDEVGQGPDPRLSGAADQERLAVAIAGATPVEVLLP